MEIEKTFTITADPMTLKRFERFLALLHFNSSVGHSCLFGMFLDGDGSDIFKAKEIDKSLFHEVNCIADVGYHIEVARNNDYSGSFIDKNKKSEYYTGKAANLYKNGEIVRTIPSQDYDYNK